MKKDFLLHLSSLVAVLLGLFGITFLLPVNLPPKNEVPEDIVQPSEEVMGNSYSPQIFISGKEGYNAGGVISIASTAEPAVQINTYNLNSSAEILLYKADEEGLLTYLAHNTKGEQNKWKNPDISRFIPISTQKKDVLESGDLVLPLDETGIYFLRIKAGLVTADSFILRSDFGVLSKEGDNQLVFWGQNFKTKRSVNSGNIRLFSLLDNTKELVNTSFDQDGIAKTNLLAEADIAIADSGESKALIPLNLRYLNTGDNYKQFQPKSRNNKYFIFTDRPLYRPGDTVYFKAVLRDDDDARYTLPSGAVQAKIYKGWDEKNVLFQKDYPVTGNGTVFGEFKLPETAAPEQYTLRINVLPIPPIDVSSRNIDSFSNNTISFRVEYFRKPEYTLELTSLKTEFTSGDNASFKISGNYFFGQPLANQKISYQVNSSDYYDYTYFSSAWSSYPMSDDYRYGWWSENNIQSGEATLDKKGEAVIDLGMKVAAGKDQVFSVEVENNDVSGNPAFARKNVLVYAGEYGIYRKENSSYGAKVGEKLVLPLILVSHQNGRVGGISLTAKVRRESWVPYQEADKKYLSYRKEEEDLGELKGQTDSQGNLNFEMVAKKEGSYIFAVTGQDGRQNNITKIFNFWVNNDYEPYVAGNSENDLVIKSDKELYEPDDVFKFTVSSSFANRDALLSLERGRVNRFQVVHLDGKTKNVDLPIEKTDIPNIYAVVSGFSDTNFSTAQINLAVSPDSKKALVNLQVNPKKTGPGGMVNVDIKTTDVNGKPLSADVAVWAVDKAIFELMPSNLGKIFETFWSQRSNTTAQAHSLEGITVNTAEMGGCFGEDTLVLMANNQQKRIVEIKAGDKILTRQGEQDSRLVEAKIKGVHIVEVPGYLILNGEIRVTPEHILWVNGSWMEAGSIQIGDYLTDAKGQKVLVSSVEWQLGKTKVYNLEIEKYRTFFAGGIWVHNEKGGAVARSSFKDTAYWNPAVHTDNAGQAKVTFKVPDNLTTWVVSVVSSTNETKVGQTKEELVVTKDVLVRPIMPNLLRVGDKANLSALVQNFSGREQSLETGLKFEQGLVKPDYPSNITVKDGGVEQLFWEVSPKEEVKKAKFTFSAINKNDKKLSDTFVQELPIEKLGFWEKKAEVGEGPKTFKINLYPDTDTDKSEIRLSLSPTIVGSLPSAMKYLLYYPYGCVEQTTSSLVPAVIAKLNQKLFPDIEEETGLKLDEIIKKGIERLAMFQNSDGGWPWWYGDSNQFVTAYVVEYLLKAQVAGFEIDASLLNNAQRFLEQEGNYDRDENVARVYALSLLSSDKGKAHLGDFENINSDILALAIMANVKNGDRNPETNGLAKLRSLAIEQGAELFWPSGQKTYFGSVDASTALAIQAMIVAGEDQERITKAVRFLVKDRRSDYWSNTFATSKTIQALVDFSQKVESPAANYSYTVLLDGKQIKNGSVTSSTAEVKEILVPIKNIQKEGSTLTVERTGVGEIYSTLVVNEFRTDKGAASVNRGLSVKREYENASHPGYSLAVGDTVFVRLTIEGLKSQENYGVVEDQLPAGLIPINPAFRNEQFGSVSNDYYNNYDVTQNGAIFYPYSVATGKQTFTYKARAVTTGVFVAPPAVTSLMYSPEIYGRSEITEVKISETAEILPQRLISEMPKGLWANPVLMVSLGIVLLVIASAFLIAKKKGMFKKSTTIKNENDKGPQKI